jgi:hypothetical protein
MILASVNHDTRERAQRRLTKSPPESCDTAAAAMVAVIRPTAQVVRFELFSLTITSTGLPVFLSNCAADQSSQMMFFVNSARRTGTCTRSTNDRIMSQRRSLQPETELGTLSNPLPPTRHQLSQAVDFMLVPANPRWSSSLCFSKASDLGCSEVMR